MQKLNYFIEGLQGAGKSTLVQKFSERLPGYTVFREGDYSPVELTWCLRELVGKRMGKILSIKEKQRIERKGYAVFLSILFLWMRAIRQSVFRLDFFSHTHQNLNCR